MQGDEKGAGGAERRGAREALLGRLRSLEDALRGAQAELLALGGEALPGLHLLVEVSGRRGLVPAAGVTEIVRLVATTPVPGAPAPVLGTFVCRGAPVVAVDLAAMVGEAREPPLDAQIAILAGSPRIGLVVDRIERLVDGPRLHDGAPSGATADGWRRAGLVAALCVVDGEVLPLVDLSPLAAMGGGRAA